MTSVETRSAAGLLALTALRGVGAVTAERLAQRFRSLEELSNATPARLFEVTSQSVASSLQTRELMADAIAEAYRILDTAARLDVQIISIFDAAYPKALKALTDRPALLFIKGSLDANERCAACIGTREPSEFGVQVTERIVEQLVKARWSIVSGLALGIDSIAHRTTLAHSGRTIAVMAGGLDGIYPRQNASLAQEILANGGALVSEQSFGTPATPRNLVQRDRLQSGLSVATFVMQTDVKGGSMHTVRFTLQQGRLLFAPVPQGRHAAEPKSRGILALTQLPGERLSALLAAEGEYKRLLESKFRDQPVACPLASREQYASMLAMLEHRVSTDPTADREPCAGVQHGLF
jgi:DNA processing protein